MTAAEEGAVTKRKNAHDKPAKDMEKSKVETNASNQERVRLSRPLT